AAGPGFAGGGLTMAISQMGFPVMALLARGGMHDLVHIEGWRQRVEQRPAWQRAIERGGPFTLPGA
ncbi:MAG: glutathione S-transferase, partial [Kalamiella piersonii]|nr:glutathione S-transferase [Pantoea piersonii]